MKVTCLSVEERDNCPIRQVLSQVTGKWQILIILALEEGAFRFGALKREIGEITQRVLTENLRKLERDGLISRTVDPGPPIAVSYALTELGWELMEHIKALAIWAAKSHPQVSESRANYDAVA
jgi:DNA-binding HxlR family transcriptional regulator